MTRPTRATDRTGREFRRAEVQPITNREAKTILEATKKIFSKFGKYPQNINTDNEFNNKLFIDFLEQHNIKLYLSYADDVIDSKNSIVERFHRTLAGMMQRYRQATGNRQWYEWIDSIVDLYNKQYHRTIHCSPYEAWDGTAQPSQEINKVESKFRVNDQVRTMIQKRIFDKGDAQTFSSDVYKILKREKNRYILENIQTGETLKRPYQQRELSNANNFEKMVPQQRQKQNREEESDERKQRKQQKLLRREEQKAENIVEDRTRGRRVRAIF